MAGSTGRVRSKRLRPVRVVVRSMTGSVVIPRLQEIYPAFTDQIHNTMLLGQAPGPSPSGEMLERFGFANTTKRVTENRFDQRQRTESGPPIGLDPIAQVLAKLWMKDRLTLDRAGCAPPT